MRSTRNFIRKWGHFVMHDKLMKPIVPPKYNVGFIISNCNDSILKELEPWCDNIYVDIDYKILPLHNEKNNDILVEINGATFNSTDFFNIQKLSQILEQSGGVGEFKLGNLFINVIQFQTYTNNLIKL